MDWEYFEKFEAVNEKYLPAYGEGETMANQIATAVNKLVYKWYNDGDVFDNTGRLCGWANDLSSYANWLYMNVGYADEILSGVFDCKTGEDYEGLLAELADCLLDEERLERYAEDKAVGSVYDCEGPFKFVEYDDAEDDEEEYYMDDDDDEYEEEW